MCGVSGAEKNAFSAEQNIAATANNFFQDTFKNNENILSGLNSVYSPIIDKGINQFGLAMPEEHAMRTNAADSISASGAATSDSVRQQMAFQGGGSSGVSNGGQAAINASLGASTEAQQNQAQEAITNYGYQVGRQNFLQAENALAAAPGELENPINAAGGAAAEAAGSALQGANQERQEQTAWEGPVLGMIGKVASAAAAAG